MQTFERPPIKQPYKKEKSYALFPAYYIATIQPLYFKTGFANFLIFKCNH